jgi:hypothetical protein
LVDILTEDPLENLKLRGLISFAARCTRRVFPIIVLADEQPGECELAIAMAESFAAGEPGSLIQARKVAKAVEYHFEPTGGGYPRTPEQNSYYARKSVEGLARSATSAFSAVTLTPPSKSCCEDALAHATQSVRDAMLATEPFRDLYERDSFEYQRFESTYKDRAQEAEWARQSARRDLEALRKTHSGPVTELGTSVDTSSRGPLGSLWGESPVPDWFQSGFQAWHPPRRVSVATAEQFFREVESCGEVPEVVCWYVSRDADSSQFKAVQEELKKAHFPTGSTERTRPVLSVYAQGIDEDRRLQLINLGATVYAEPLDERFEPNNSEEFRDLLRYRLLMAYSDWTQDESGLWTYTGARVGWRIMGTEQFEPPPTEEERELSSPISDGPSDFEPTFSKEDYMRVLRYLSSRE